jgi:hypothetical protein
MFGQENGEEVVEGSLLAAGLDVFWHRESVVLLCKGVSKLTSTF